MITRPEFHLLRHSSSDVVYHPDSASLLNVTSEAAELVRYGELTWDPFERHGANLVDEFAHEALCSRLLEKIDRAKIQRYLSKKQPSYEEPENLSKLVLLVSHACNMGCTYCFQGGLNQETRYMTPETACQVVQVFLSRYPGRLRTILFFGGEPLLNWKTIQAVVGFTLTYCQERQIERPRFALQTNGTLIDEQKADFLKKYEFLVTLSLDGPPVVNDAQRVFLKGNGTYEKVLQGVSRLIAYGIRFNMEATITRLHMKLGVPIKEVFEHLLDLGAHCVHIMPITGPYSTLRISTEVIEDIVSQFADLAADSVYSLATNHPKRLQYVLYVIENLVMGAKKHICYAGTGTVTVNADGDIYPCYFLTSDDLLMGNIYEENLSEEQYYQIQSRMAGHTKEHIWPCKECWARHLCNACYGAEPSVEKKLSAPASEVCLIQRGIIDATLSTLIEISNVPERWNSLMRNVAGEFGISD